MVEKTQAQEAIEPSSQEALRKRYLPPFLSLLLPGLGQAVTGRLVRGGALLGVMVPLYLLINWRSDEVILSLAGAKVETRVLLVGLVALWLWNVWDAYSLARGALTSFAIPLVLIAVIVYVIAWGVTGINLPKLVTDAADVRPLVMNLLQPDLLERDIEEQRGIARFNVPCDESAPEPSVPREGEPYLIPSKGCGEIGEEFTVEGGNLWPSHRVKMWWVDDIGTQLRVRQLGEYVATETDGEGRLLPMTIIARAPTPEGVGHGTIHWQLQARLEREVGPPHLSKTFYMVLEKIIETVFLALMATTMAIFFAIPISFVAARNLMSASRITVVMYYVVRGILNVFRSIEPLIMAIIFVVWVGLGPFAGVLALAVHSVAALGKLYSEQVESIDPGPIEAITAAGANRVQTVVYGVIPQVVPPFIAFTLYRWDINVRMSTIIGFVGGGGIGFLIQQWIRLLAYNEAATAVWAIAIVVAALDYTSAIVRARYV